MGTASPLLFVSLSEPTFLLFHSQENHSPDLFHAGGFIATADEIVQPFSLPRYQYIRPKDHDPSPPADNDVEMVPDLGRVVDEEIPSTVVIGDGSGNEVEGDALHSETEMTNEPMKTMAELAAEHADRERQLRPTRRSRRGVNKPSRARQESTDEDEPEADEDEDHLAPSLSDYPSDSPRSKRKAASPKELPRANTRPLFKPTPTPRRKRQRSLDNDEDSDIENEGSSGSKARSAKPRPRRATGEPGPRTGRRATGSSAVSIAVPASDRVLRSRKARV